MFHVNDTIMYGSQSVCKIADIIQKSFNRGEKMSYYVLKPVYDNQSTIYVPVSNKGLLAKMRRVLSADEIYKIIKAIPDEKIIWIENENLRKEKYKEIISKGNRMELLKLIKTLYLYGEKRKEIGKKLCLSDERMMKEAEKILYDEFALVLQIQREQVLPFILNQGKQERQ